MNNRKVFGYGIEKLGGTLVMCIVRRYIGMYAGLLYVESRNSGILPFNALIGEKSNIHGEII
jgi:hypothetical protein